MFLRTISALLLLLFSVSIQAQVSDNTFKKEWSEIDSLMMKAGLPKSALEKVKELTASGYPLSLNFFTFSQFHFLPFSGSSFRLYFLCIGRNAADQLHSARIFRLVHLVDDHLLAKADDVAKEPV